MDMSLRLDVSIISPVSATIEYVFNAIYCMCYVHRGSSMCDKSDDTVAICPLKVVVQITELQCRL